MERRRDRGVDSSGELEVPADFSGLPLDLLGRHHMGNLLDCQENCIVQPDSPVIGFADLSVLELDGLRSPFACRAVFDLVFGDLSGAGTQSAGV